MVAAVLAGLAAAATHGRWLPALTQFVAAAPSDPRSQAAAAQAAAAVQEGQGDRSCVDEGSATSLEVSEQGRRNIGLTLVTIEPRDFSRTVSIPGVVVARPGRTEIGVSASMTGTVTRIYPIRGEAVGPGAPLFDVRLTHEDLVEKQSALFRAVEELDVVEREVARLQRATSSGAVAGKALLERQYEQQKLEAAIRAQRQALLLHGLTEEQVERIVATRQLLQTLTIAAPSCFDRGACREHEDFFQVTELLVREGDHVAAGAPLATLTDHCELYVEGKAFEHDAGVLHAAAAGGTTVSAIVQENGAGKLEVEGLRLLYVENQIDRESRALKFYVSVPNELIRNEMTPDGHRFIGWRYKPGQRVEVLLPLEQWKDCIVLPAAAVVDEGVESFVFLEKGRRFERIAVHVEYRDSRWAVIASDGTLFPGDRVAASGAYQLHLALKARAGGGADAHAGHHH